MVKQRRAKDGRSWAQAKMGLSYLDGDNGFPVDKTEAFKWFELAAEQRHPFALHHLAEIYYEGLGDIVEQSYSKVRVMMKEAADLGYILAQVKLFRMYCKGE